MQFVMPVAIGLACAILGRWANRRRREAASEAEADSEYLMGFLGGMVGLMVLFVIGAGAWYLVTG